MENKFNSHLEETLDDKPPFSAYNEAPCSSKQADASMESLATSKPSTQCIDVKPKKSLSFDANVFVPSIASAGAVKTVAPTPGPPSKLSSASTPAVLPPISLSMKLPQIILHKFYGNPLEWPEWSRKSLAGINGSGASDSNKTQYLKCLVSGKAKAAIESRGFSDQMYQVAWQALEHNFRRPELVVNAQLRKIHAHPFIKPHHSLEIVKYSQIVSGCVNVLSQYGYESDTNSESVMSSSVRKLPRELQNMWMT